MQFSLLSQMPMTSRFFIASVSFAIVIFTLFSTGCTRSLNSQVPIIQPDVAASDVEPWAVDSLSRTDWPLEVVTIPTGTVAHASAMSDLLLLHESSFSEGTFPEVGAFTADGGVLEKSSNGSLTEGVVAPLHAGGEMVVSVVKLPWATEESPRLAYERMQQQSAIVVDDDCDFNNDGDVVETPFP